MTSPADPPASPEPADQPAAEAATPTQAHPAAGPAEPTAEWRAPEGDAATVTPATPGRVGVLQRPRTRFGLAVAGALVVGAAAGSAVTAAVSDGDGHHGGRDGNSRFDRDAGRDGRMQQGRFGDQNRDGNRGDRGNRNDGGNQNGGNQNGGNQNGGNQNGGNQNGGAPGSVPSTTPSATPSGGASTSN